MRQAGPAERSRRGIHPILCPGRHCNPAFLIRTLRLKHRFVFPALRFWSPLFIDAARSCTQIDTTSSPMGLQHTASKLRSGYVEGLWSRARYESPVRVRSFVTSSFKVHLPVDLWCSIETEPGGAWLESGGGGEAGRGRGCKERVMRSACAGMWTSSLPGNQQRETVSMRTVSSRSRFSSELLFMAGRCF